MPLITTTFVLTTASALVALVLLIRLVRHIIRGVTTELRLAAWAFLLLALSWITAAAGELPLVHQGTLSLLFAPYGLAWYVVHGLLLLGIGLLLKWAWHYISLRLLPQFYLSIVAIGLSAFVLSTVVFTSVLFTSSEQQALRSIEADVKTFSLALSELTDRTAFTAAAIAARDSLTGATGLNDAAGTAIALGDPITDYSLSAAYVLNAGGEVLASQGTESIVGQSFAADPVAQRVLEGEVIGSPLLLPGVEAPTIVIRGGSPLVREGKVVGAVLVDSPLDTAFVDRVGSITGLAVTVYAQQHRVATTLRDDDGQPLVPATMEDPALADVTLNQGKVFSGSSTFASLPYFVAAVPLINVDQARIGALAAGLPQQSLLDSLARATQISFLVSFGLLIVALVPFFFIARFLARSVAEAR